MDYVERLLLNVRREVQSTRKSIPKSKENDFRLMMDYLRMALIHYQKVKKGGNKDEIS